MTRARIASGIFALAAALLLVLVLRGRRSKTGRETSVSGTPNAAEARHLKALLARLQEEERQRRGGGAALPSVTTGTRRSDPAAPRALPERQGSGASRAPPRDTSQRATVADADEAGPWILDDIEDLGAAGPITAHPLGVLTYDVERHLYLAPLGRLSRSRSPQRTPLQPIDAPAVRFPLGRGAAIFRDHAYWISHGSLVRQRLGARGGQGPLQVLANDARDGTRVAAPLPVPAADRRRGSDDGSFGELGLAPLPATVLYVRRPDEPDGPLTAKLWVEGARSVPITADASTSNAVALVHTRDGVLAFYLEGRTAMSPVHARPVHFTQGQPRAGEDLVAWIGGRVDAMTELAVLPIAADHLVAALPNERDITEFGLSLIDLAVPPAMESPSRWLLYPNGLDPAPMALGALCSQPVVIHAQPSHADPDSPQELMVRSLEPGARPSVQRVARSRGFFDVAYSAVPGGGLIAYVADRRIWARTIRCAEGAK